VRRDRHDELRRLQREKEISEDAQYLAQEALQKLTDGFIQEVERVGEEKEADLLAV
jgi:ribosome recycling factor